MKTLQDYTADIIQYHNAIKLDPNNEQYYKKKIDNIIGKWQQLLDITIFVAGNEQIPWKDTELNLKTRPMLTKAELGFNQVADYHAFVDGYGGYYLPFVVDRKTMGDLYGTLMKKDNRLRFYRELDRFKQDTRFNDFFIFAECDLISWLNYQPPNPKEENNLRINQKLAVIGSLASRGCSVIFCGNRSVAIHLYRDYVRQYCIKNYEQILNL